MTISIGGLARGEDSPPNLAALQEESYIYIATVRKDGNQSKAAPVWFIAPAADQFLVNTTSDSWKVRRIRRGSPVLVWVGSLDGPAFIGKAEIVEDKAVQDMMIEQFPRKYFLARIGLFGPRRSRLDSGKTVALKISPARPLPAGFKSQPGTPAPTLQQDAQSNPAH